MAVWGETAGPFTLPEGVETDTWLLSYDGDARLVEIAVVGDQIYLGNLTDELSSAYVIGTIDGDHATFPITYLGWSAREKKSVYFVPATWDTRYVAQAGGDWTDYFITDSFVFSWDAEAKELETTEEYAAIFIGFNDTVGALAPAYLEYFFEPNIVKLNYEAVNAPLQNPEFIEASRDDFFECDVIDMYISPLNSGNYPLDTDKMYYVFYVDGQPFTFTTQDYFGLEENMTEIPYNYTDEENFDIFCNGPIHEVSLYISGYQKVGVKVYYMDPDGQLMESELVEADIEELSNGEISGVENIDASSADARIDYYDLSGRKVLNPSTGVYVKVVTTPDGRRKTTKTLLIREPF